MLDPLKLIIDNYPEGKSEDCFAPNHPFKPELGKRVMPFSRELWIEREDFMEVPSKGYHRLYPGQSWRACATATSSNAPAATRMRTASVIAVHCEYLPDTKTGTPGADSVKVKGNLHWVSVAHGYAAEVRLYDRLFACPAPGARREGDADERGARLPRRHQSGQRRKSSPPDLEPSLKDAQAGRALPVRAARLLRRRPHRLAGRRAGVQPHGDAQGFLEQQGMSFIASLDAAWAKKRLTALRRPRP